MNPDAPNTAFINGIWFVNDDRDINFESKDIYSVNGVFTEEEPVRIDTVINLQNTYIVPPFGDAHNHAFADYYSVGFSDDLFLKRGIFYSMNLTNPYTGAESVSGLVNTPESIDVAYSHGGISANKGSRPHPASIMERLYSYMAEDTTSQWPLEGNAHWFMNSEEDVKQKWPDLMAQNPDVIKVYIMRYGEDDSDLPDCGFGLCPDELEMIVDSANAADKRVFAHINTATDFQLALDMGVDGITHLPLGNDGLTIEDAEQFTLSESTIQQAGEMEIILTPTAHLLTEELESFRQDTLSDIIALQRSQLRKLRDAGVTIALGADGWDDDPLREVMYMNAYNFFSNAELLTILAQDTPTTIFPERKIASLSEGFEASFLALDCNPIMEFNCIEKIKTIIKQGVHINLN